MTTYVKAIMTDVVTSIELDYTVEELERIMDLHNIHCLPVIDNVGQCVGVVSTSDLIHWHNIKHRCEEILAWEVCTHQVIEVNPYLPVVEAVNVMVENSIHHLVVSQHNELIGIVSSMDIMAFFVQQNNPG